MLRPEGCSSQRTSGRNASKGQAVFCLCPACTQNAPFAFMVRFALADRVNSDVVPAQIIVNKIELRSIPTIGLTLQNGLQPILFVNR